MATTLPKMSQPNVIGLMCLSNELFCKNDRYSASKKGSNPSAINETTFSRSFLMDCMFNPIPTPMINNRVKKGRMKSR